MKLPSVFRSRVLFAILPAVLALNAGCGLFKKKGGGQSSNASTEAAPPAAAPDTTIRTGTVGIKNLNQLAPALSAVTGVPIDTFLGNQSSIAAPWLSYDGDVRSVNASMLLTMTGMAGNFCKAFIAKEAQLQADGRKAHQAVNFALGPAAISKEIASVVIKRYGQMFWRRDPDAEEAQILLDSVAEASTANQITSKDATLLSQATQNTLLVPCTAVASSLEFIRE